MKEEFEARMLRIYFGESDKWQGKPLHEAILLQCQELDVASAVVYRGIEGYGSSTRIRHTRALRFSRDAPMMVSILDSEEKISRLIPQLEAMVGEGLIAISKVDVTRYSRAEKEQVQS